MGESYYFITHQNNLLGDGGISFIVMSQMSVGDRTFYLWDHPIDHSYMY